MIVLGQEWLYLGKSGCIRENVVLIGKKVLYLGKNGYIW